MNNFDEEIEKLLEEAKKYKPCANLDIDKESHRVSLYLDTSKNTYSEWIKGEGSDISLIRDTETDKVVGVNLPLYLTNFSISFNDGIEVKLNKGFLKMIKCVNFVSTEKEAIDICNDFNACKLDIESDIEYKPFLPRQSWEVTAKLTQRDAVEAYDFFVDEFIVETDFRGAKCFSRYCDVVEKS